jgi:glutamyl-tRNA reductase
VLARQIFGDLQSKTVVLVGAGEMIQLCGRYLRDHDIANLLIVNRSLEKAEELAVEMGATALTLDRLGEALPRADILISSTASPGPVIMKADIKTALRKRRHRPMFLVDIAVPRDIDPQISKLKDVFLYTIDDLQQVVDENMEQRTAAAKSASADVDESVKGFMRWLSGIRAARTLKRIRDQSHEFEQDLTQRALKRLDAGHNPAAVLEQLTKTLTNKILHLPSKRLREAAENQDYEVLKAADRIFRNESPEENE